MAFLGIWLMVVVLELLVGEGLSGGRVVKTEDLAPGSRRGTTAHSLSLRYLTLRYFMGPTMGPTTLW